MPSARANGRYSPFGSAIAAKRGCPPGDASRPSDRYRSVLTTVLLPFPTRPRMTMFGEVMMPWVYSSNGS